MVKYTGLGPLSLGDSRKCIPGSPQDNHESPVSSKTMTLMKVMVTMIGMMLMLMSLVPLMIPNED